MVIFLFMIVVPTAEANSDKKLSVDDQDQKIERRGDPFDRIREMSQRMDQMFQKQMEEIRKGFGQGFGNNFGSHGVAHQSDSDLKISQREDGSNIYIDVEGEGVQGDGLNIDIKNGMIKFSGEIKKTVKNESENGSSYSSYSSYFSRSMNIPQGADEKSAEFEKNKGKLVIKFKRKNII